MKNEAHFINLSTHPKNSESADLQLTVLEKNKAREDDVMPSTLHPQLSYQSIWR